MEGMPKALEDHACLIDKLHVPHRYPCGQHHVTIGKLRIARPNTSSKASLLMDSILIPTRYLPDTYQISTKTASKGLDAAQVRE